MFSLSLGSVSTLFRRGGNFCHIYIYIYIYNISSCLQQCKNYKNPSRFSRVMITNVLPLFYGSQCMCYAEIGAAVIESAALYYRQR